MTPAKVAELLARSGALIHPATRDQWGLAVNEAMASGLPVIVSTGAGCCRDLVVDGVNGFTFDPLDTGLLADIMRRVTSEDAERMLFGRASRERISDWSPETFAHGLAEAIRIALRNPPRFRIAAQLVLTLLRVVARRPQSFHAVRE
ncbi:MAG: glycosyltransferase [Rhodothermales bacterium]